MNAIATGSRGCRGCSSIAVVYERHEVIREYYDNNDVIEEFCGAILTPPLQR